MMRRVTTHDIAREAGVARTTVSHILNNRPGIIISPKTRERVLTIARKLGYVANSAAQMLVTGRSQTIGLILSRPDLISVDAFVPMMVFGLNEACRTQGYRLLMELPRSVLMLSNRVKFLERLRLRSWLEKGSEANKMSSRLSW